jgi:chemotaxis-related protein WspB
MLLLVFRVAGEPYAVEAGRVVEVVPRVELRALPHAPGELAGLFRYRGRVVPVIDLGVLLGGGPCASRLSTRIVLVDGRTPGSEAAKGEAHARFGLIAEHVSDVRRVDDDRVVPASALLGGNPHLGPIASTDEGLIPLLDVDRIAAGPALPVVAEAAP